MNRKMFDICFLLIVLIFLSATLGLANSNKIAVKMKAPVNEKVLKMGVTAADIKPEGVHILESEWMSSGEGFEAYRAYIYNKTQNDYPNIYIGVYYYSNVEQNWIKGGEQLAGSLNAMGKSWHSLRVKERLPQYDKIKIQIRRLNPSVMLKEIIIEQ